MAPPPSYVRDFFGIGNITLLTGIIIILSLLFSSFNQLRYANEGTAFGAGCCAKGNCGQQGIDNVLWWAIGSMIIILSSIWVGIIAVIFTAKDTPPKTSVAEIVNAFGFA